MEKFSKVIAVISNLLCLSATLFMPSSATLITLVPLVSAACSWILDSAFEQKRLPSEKQNKNKLIVYGFCAWGILILIGSLLIAIFCECLVDSGSPPLTVLVIRASVMAIGGLKFSYVPFAIVAATVIAPLYIGELFMTHQPPPKYEQSICCTIAAEIAKAHN